MTKINRRDIWIGENVRIISSGKEGKFEGLNTAGKARVSHKGKVYLTPLSNIEIIPPKEYIPEVSDLLNDKIAVKKPLKIKIEHTLDLHIEKLAPHLLHKVPPYILDFQINKSREFIENAIEHNYPHITIIHGKGQGVLKSAIENLLKTYPRIRFTFSKHDGGAVEIWL
jgi:dsDNA-specific endonuclease/ATPase MutS2